jgi:hypothetical protein
MRAAVRVRHDDLGIGWCYPDLRAHIGRDVFEFCTFDNLATADRHNRGTVWAYVPTRDLHSFGVQAPVGGAQ